VHHIALSSATGFSRRPSGSRQVLRTRERRVELVAGGASQTMHSRHLTGHAVDLVALGGSEISW
jgi:peptidoglycan L-alanyl-D-glutamate endopeptidase CwlK